MRQSTPRRRLQEAQLADKIYNVGGSSGTSLEQKQDEEKRSPSADNVSSIFAAANKLARSSVSAALKSFASEEEENNPQ